MSGDHVMEVLLNEVSEDGLIAEPASSEWAESPEIALISAIADKATPKTLPSYCLPLPPFLGLFAISVLS